MLAEVPAGDGQSDEEPRLGVPVIAVAVQPQRMLNLLEGLFVLAQMVMDGGPDTQRVGLHPAATDLAAQVTVDGCEQPEGVCFAAVSRLAVQSYRLVEVVEGVVGPSEGMQGLGGVDEVVRLAATGSELACQRQRFSVVLESLYEPAHLPICSGKAGMVAGLAAKESGLLIDGERQVIVVDGLLKVAEFAVDDGEVVEAGRLTVPPAATACDVQRPVVVVDGLSVPFLEIFQLREAELGGGLTPQVTGRCGGGEAGLCGNLPVGERPTQGEVAAQGVGEQPYGRLRAAFGGIGDGCDKVGFFDSEPCGGLGRLIELSHGDGGDCWPHGQAQPLRV